MANPTRLQWLAFLFWLAAAGVLIYTAVGPSGLRDLHALREQRTRLSERVAELEAENARLATQIERLEKDPAYLERLARERLGMIRADEWVVVVPPADKR